MNKKVKLLKKLSNSEFFHGIVIIFFTLIYFLLYFAHPALPGNNKEFPLGWWGWLDQSLYLKASLATSEFDFTGKNYFYPPLYPILGAMFVKLNPMHPFFIINITCFIIYINYFLKLGKLLIGYTPALLALLLAIFSNRVLNDVWVEPWTTTLTAAISAMLIFKIYEYRGGIDAYKLFLFGLMGGLIFSTRPIDAVIISPIYLLLIIKIYKLEGNQIFSYINLFSGALIGLVIFLGFNKIVYGSFSGLYFSQVSNYGFNFANLLSKSISIFMDSGALYGEPFEAIFYKIKWFSFIIPAIIFGLLIGNNIVKLLATISLLYFIFYFSYVDLLPNGIWRYHNIHYFKFIIPYITLLIFLWLKYLFNIKNILINIFIIAISSLIFCLQIKLIDSNQILNYKYNFINENLEVNLKLKNDSLIDKIFIKGLHGDFNSLYTMKNSDLLVDGVKMIKTKDYRLIPEINGTSILFLNSIKADNIELKVKNVNFQDVNTTPIAYIFKYFISKPIWLSLDEDAYKKRVDLQNKLSPRYAANIEDGINFSKAGYPYFLSDVEGLSGVEPWGRWTETSLDGKVRFIFTDPLPQNFKLEIIANAFGPNTNSPISVLVGDEKYSLTIDNSPINKKYFINIINQNKSNLLEFDIPHPTRPRDVIPGNPDSRMLGIGFISMRILKKG